MGARHGNISPWIAAARRGYFSWYVKPITWLALSDLLDLISDMELAAPHVSGLLACLLSSELTQQNANTQHWSVDAVRQKLEKSFSRNTSTYKSYNINTIYNNLKNAKEEFPAIKQLQQAPAGLTEEMVITGAVITGSVSAEARV